MLLLSRPLWSLPLLCSILACFVSQGNANDETNATTKITSYAVKTTIQSRFAQTLVTVDFSNNRNCAALHGFTMQIPNHARVTALDMNLTDGCTLSSIVAPEQDAQNIFNVSHSSGRPAAILTASDMQNYAVQVSLPPMGNTTVRISYEELLEYRQHKVAFQVPLSPGLDVESLFMEVKVDEPTSGVSDFSLDDIPKLGIEISRDEGNALARLHLQNVLESDEIPRLLHGSYVPIELPPEGVLIGSEYCLMHLFNPASLLEDTGAIPRNIVFVIDVSGSMSGQKLSDAKKAFSSIIATLTSNDYFAVHSFSDKGTEGIWGPEQATEDAKTRATNDFVSNLATISSTNLHGAYLNGIDRVKAMQIQQDAHVPIVIILSDGQATSGVTDSREIAAAVRDKNGLVKAKIYALAFGVDADLPLLTAISLQNGGTAVPIVEGFGDGSNQIEDFYRNHLDTILLSDINIDIDGTDIEEQTESVFSLLSSGSELVLRAKTVNANPFEAPDLRVITSATTAQGENTWILETVDGSVGKYPKGECLQSFAHAKIYEVLQVRDAASSIGDDLGGAYTSLFKSNNEGMSLEESIEAKALALALDAGLVWPGLTALVTVEGSSCAGLYEDNEVCSTGDDLSETDYDEDFAMEADMAYAPPPQSSSQKAHGATHAPAPAPAPARATPAPTYSSQKPHAATYAPTYSGGDKGYAHEANSTNYTLPYLGGDEGYAHEANNTNYTSSYLGFDEEYIQEDDTTDYSGVYSGAAFLPSAGLKSTVLTLAVGSVLSLVSW